MQPGFSRLYGAEVRVEGIHELSVPTAVIFDSKLVRGSVTSNHILVTILTTYWLTLGILNPCRTRSQAKNWYLSHLGSVT